MPDDSPWKEVLPLVVDAATRSAEASTAAASAIGSFEKRMTSVESSLSTCAEKLTSLIALEDEKRKRDTEKTAWLRSIFTPQFLVYLITLLLALAGVRMSILPEAPLSLPTENGERTP
tara:strand:+ start:308 stop:661 length:354 start_codon:yes stop_codon:yes gene_type:complete